ncbi:ABC-type dipeptide/oligopeptide/nickel transport system, permease component (plasmid) [Neorhizobium galegae bv. orientalis str. HAMBI 540]|uniref:ABC-type dipeptide/oligopeptide/nickel transport system, permease component n=3 Tax=Rhizobium/Agrobacterium group TaxID=227290 RepID=A0A068SX67_NEOGA|nr:ABC-type dipeptide/oligopeptide/nickel transport system, permease component [Neorhizobium galegae bv. orientalis str. HAMBI 540]CDN52123.1 ABC-type dipeptide/oligopeptide/nickel transport system, permease component [Neorhizobium galegae bv. orientalis str. HAMBI 540]
MAAQSLDMQDVAMNGTRSNPNSAFRRLLAVIRELLGNPSSGFGLVVITILVLTAIVAPLIAPYDPNVIDLGNTLKPPSAEHWFGTDELGRDIMSRIIYGTRISLTIITIVSVIVGPIGLLVGTTAGYFGGWYDTIMMRITDIFLSFPSLILSLAFVAALGAGLENAIIAIGLTTWPPIARLARAETLTFRGADYISASRMQGASALRIIIKSIMPMCLPSVLVRITLSMATVILTAAGLGFLGLGAQPPLPEWGAMIATGRRYMLDNWWLVAFPGGAILLVSLAFNLLGDGLRDALDPKQR